MNSCAKGRQFTWIEDREPTDSLGSEWRSPLDPWLHALKLRAAFAKG